MAETQDVVIIGGGAIGICCAYYLLERGFAVTVIEQSAVGAGSSYGNGGLIVPSYAVPLAAPGVWRQSLQWLLDPASPFYIKPRPDPALARWLLLFLRACAPHRLPTAIDTLVDLTYASRALFAQLAALPDVNFGYIQRGGLALYLSQAALEAGAEEAHLLNEHGVAARVVSAAEVRALEPNVLSAVVGGISFPDDAHVIPHQFVEQLAQVVRSKGGVIHTDLAVTGFQRAGRRLTGVITPTGTFSARQIILASG
ncbi:MAG TPA: FAD-dependent oxidoreductase, partial [Phototrophicaceae bacterium]|nr:FAD-dependent oxidoreductase [Phototrophicaceae bacterium]